jgi:diguanylate cyclase (GGDEF)-like protein
MQPRQILRVLFIRRWLILGTMGIAILFAEALTLSQAPVYQATGSYVLQLTGGEDAVTAIDILSRRPEIASTFAEVASSRTIRQEAAGDLGLSAQQLRDFSVNSRLVAGTNILEVSVQGNDPELVVEFASAVGLRTLEFVQRLYAVFSLEPLDEPQPPRNPIRPNPMLNLVIGGLLGLSLGIALALATSLIESGPAVVAAPRGLIVDAETGAYTHSFFVQRLREETARSMRNHYPISVALMEVNHGGVLDIAAVGERKEAMRRVASTTVSVLRPEDVVARFSDTVLGLLLLDTPSEKASELLHRLTALISASAVRLDGATATSRLHPIIGVASYDGVGRASDDLLAEARGALEAASGDPGGSVRRYSAQLPA